MAINYELLYLCGICKWPFTRNAKNTKYRSSLPTQFSNAADLTS